jgi:hypothetical protein
VPIGPLFVVVAGVALIARGAALWIGLAVLAVALLWLAASRQPAGRPAEGDPRIAETTILPLALAGLVLTAFGILTRF